MPFVAPSPGHYLGTVVGDGHCVAFVRAAATAPHTSTWVEGDAVWQCAAELRPGTAIATFDAAGKYANATDGSSHAAIFISADDDGMTVYDQWKLHPVAMRVIRSKDGAKPACDDADAYAVIETA